MRFIVASLFFVALIQLSACGRTSDQSRSTDTETAEIMTTAISPAAEQAAEPKVKKNAPAEDPDQMEAPAPQAPKAVKAAQKKVINESPVKAEIKPGPGTTSPEQKETSTMPSAPASVAKVQTLDTTLPPIEKEGKPLETENVPAKKTETDLEVKPDHSQWHTLLQKYVSPTGKVNYAGFKSDKAKLQAYLDELAANPVQDNWSRAEKMAYWINVYNAFTIKLIVNNYPVSSITKIHNGKPWDVKWIKLGNKTYSLNEVENDILRPKYQDARIHFAVNCAAKSCPPLLNRAWTADNLDNYLEKQTRSFINNSKYNTISAREAHVSKIFEWYASDFGNLIEFLNKYAASSINKSASVTFKEYDWALNN